MADRQDKKTPKFRFSGHQTFAFRYGWLEKGIRAVQADHTAFSQENALVELGVGKNMVDSIKHWCLVTQMLEEEAAEKRQRSVGLRPSPIAHRLILEPGWDPFFEDDASLWLVHWLLVSNPTVVTTWQIVFSGAMQRPDASKSEIADFVASYAYKHGAKVNDASLARDVECFVRCYTPVKGTRQGMAEESFDCPLQELNLIQPSPDGELYRFGVGAKQSLPAHVFGFALAQYFDRTREEVPTMGVQECLYGLGSPGQAFKLDENSVVDYLEELEKITHGDLVFDETEGFRQIYRARAVDPLMLLESYYTTEVRQ